MYRVQVVRILKEAAAGKKVVDVCREYSISDATFYTWRKKGSALEYTDGFEGSESDLLRRGVLIARGFTGPKARIKLLLALSADVDRKTVIELFKIDGLGMPDQE